MDSPYNDPNSVELIKSFRKEIIDRKWAEKKANDALDYAESILDSVLSPIIVLDNEYKIISVNLPFFHLFNISIEKIIGKYFFEISDSLFNIDILKEMIISNEKDINEFELFHEFKIVGKKYLQIKCVNLQYNIKHLNFKLVIINDVTDYKNTMEEIRIKHSLLSKIHNRTKNNLIMIESLLKLQLKSVQDQNVKNFLIDNISRVSAVTSVHLILSKSDNFDNIDFNQFVCRILDNIKSLYQKEVKFNIDQVDIQLNFDQGIYFGIILNEILTHSYKYSFANSNILPEIGIHLSRIGNSKKLLCVISDNGNNEMQNLDLDKSLGVMFIKDIVESKLNGKWEVNYNNGLIYRIEFEEESTIIELEDGKTNTVL